MSDKEIALELLKLCYKSMEHEGKHYTDKGLLLKYKEILKWISDFQC